LAIDPLRKAGGTPALPNPEHTKGQRKVNSRYSERNRKVAGKRRGAKRVRFSPYVRPLFEAEIPEILKAARHFANCFAAINIVALNVKPDFDPE